MNSRLKTILFVLFFIVAMGGFLYADAYALLRNHMVQALQKQGYKNIQYKGLKPFMDGLVVDELTLDGRVTLHKIYFHGSPLAIYKGNPDYISVEHITLNDPNPFAHPLSWPFDQSIPLTVDNFSLNAALMDKSIAVTGRIKQNPGTPILIDFQSTSDALAMAGQAEMRSEGAFLKTIDITLDGGEADLGLLKAKRSSGWISFAYEGNWQMLGEMEFGFVTIGSHEFFNGNLKFSGPGANPGLYFLAVDAAKKPWALELNGAGLSLQKENNPPILSPWSGFNSGMMHKISGLITQQKSYSAAAAPLAD